MHHVVTPNGSDDPKLKVFILTYCSVGRYHSRYLNHFRWNALRAIYGSDLSNPSSGYSFWLV